MKRTFRKADYLLSFWVEGVSVLVTDVHRVCYARLEALFIIDRGLFKQYFTNRAYEQALAEGLKFYSSPTAVERYQQELRAFMSEFRSFFSREIAGDRPLTAEAVATLFRHTVRLCGDYTRMNFEFTDRAFAARGDNPTIDRNLSLIAGFKDEVRTFMNQVLFDEGGYLATAFEKLAKQFSLPSALLEQLTQTEILDLFEGVRPDEARVLQRQEAFVCSYDQPAPIEGEAARAIIAEFRESLPTTRTLTGQVASRGTVTGTVKVIPVDYANPARVVAAMAAMDPGDILVAETTAPELMIACRKAGAIVTDMGGLMSHAAIVSREFGIPCIVGTKHASKVLKDGDRVEVDAERGIVIRLV